MTTFSLCKEHRASVAAFNILELLVVLSLIAILGSLSVPAITSMSRGGNVNRATAAIASSLELARQHAVSQNTYTWVIVAGNPEAPNQAVHVVVLGSKDGTRTADGVTPVALDGSGSYNLSNTAHNLVQLRRAELCQGARLEEIAGAVSAPCEVRFSLPGSVESIRFLNQHPELQRVVQFGPNGQARVSDSLSQTISMGIASANSRADETMNIAAIQIDGFTGMTRVMRQ